MLKESWIYRLLKRIGLIKTRELSWQEKEAACERALRSNVCHNDCNHCAFGDWAERFVNG